MVLLSDPPFTDSHPVSMLTVTSHISAIMVIVLCLSFGTLLYILIERNTKVSIGDIELIPAISPSDQVHVSSVADKLPQP
jgi:hypothetical protein